MDASLFRNSISGKPRLRIGLLLDSASLPRWTAEVVDHILKCDFAAIELLVFNGIANDPRSAITLASGAVEKRSDGRSRTSFLYTSYQRWDRRNVEPLTDPLAMVDCSGRLADTESVRVVPIVKDFAQQFPDDALDRIREKKLDVLIQFGFANLSGDILGIAKYGLWKYHHADPDNYRGGPAYFWEVLEGNPVSGAALLVVTGEPDGNKVLYSGLFATDEGFSHVRNCVQPYWGASTFLIQKLRELHACGWDHLEQNQVKPALYRGRRPIYTTPTNAEMLWWLVPLLIGKIWRRLFRRPMIRHWRIAIRVGAQPVPNAKSLPDMSGFHWVDTPEGHAYADPFVIEADGKSWVYFEDFDYFTQLGKISCAEVRGATLGEPMTVLERPYHLSYPCVFRDAGAWYMIPETMAAGTVDLYRCARFPDQWQFERELFKGFAVDTTIWIENGVYWFFVTIIEPRGGASQLWLYSASALTEPWTPHPANPISTDVRYARGGGAIFRHEGRLFRPSQDDSGEYGRSMTLNEILIINHAQYREEPSVTVDPALMKDLVGTHTYGRAGAVEVIDGKTRIPARLVLHRSRGLAHQH